MIRALTLALIFLLALPTIPSAQAPPCETALLVARAQRDNAEVIAANLLARLRELEKKPDAKESK